MANTSSPFRTPVHKTVACEYWLLGLSYSTFVVLPRAKCVSLYITVQWNDLPFAISEYNNLIVPFSDLKMLSVLCTRDCAHFFHDGGKWSEIKYSGSVGTAGNLADDHIQLWGRVKPNMCRTRDEDTDLAKSFNQLYS